MILEFWLLMVGSGINVYTFMLFAVDKHHARQGYWRMSERHLWWAIILGGSLGAYIAMHLFHPSIVKLSATIH